MKTYLEIKVPISYNAPWFSELRKALKDMPVHWQNGYYHITMAFLDETRNIPEIEAIMHSYLDNANAVSITFNKLDVFTTNSGMKIVHLTTDSIPDDFQKLVNNIRNDISGNTSTSILSDFRLHVTLGRISMPEADINDVGFLIDEIDFSPFTLTLNEVEYRVFRGRSLYYNCLK
jgi:2'-5' RNA ligase